MAKHTSKATRKFEKNHLKDAIDKRKAIKKIKQRNAKGKPQKKFVAVEEPTAEEVEEQLKQKAAKAAAGPAIFENMSVEQFFQGGFEVPNEPNKVKKAREKAKKDAAKVEEKSGAKRKRSEPEPVEVEDEEKEEEEESDEEEDEAEETGETIEDHKGQLAALAEKDPEFFKYLQENDSELLDFKMSEKELDDMEFSDEEEEEEELELGSKNSKKTKSKKAVNGDDEDEEEEEESVSTERGTHSLRKADVEKWTEALNKQHSLRALKEVILAFRSAAHVGEDDGTTFKYTITDPDVYHELLVLALASVPSVLNHHLPIKVLPNRRVRLSTETKKYRTLTPLLKTHSASILHLLSTLTDPATTKLVLKSTELLIPYFTSFRRFLRDFIRQTVDIWSSSSAEETTRLTAYLVLHRIVLIADAGLREACLKTAYAGFLKGCRGTTAHTLLGINLVKNGMVSLLGVDEEGVYMLGFGYVRQLAVHLRGSITKNEKESYKTVYNWQYVHSLDFWSRVLSTYCDGLKEAENGKESPLRPLIYPLVQVTLGAARLIPTSQYFPLRLHLIRSLIRLSRHTSTFIPLSPLILELLSSNELKHAPRASTLRPLDFSVIIRAPKTYLKTRTYQDGLGEQFVEVLSEFFLLHTKSVAFPELSVPTIVLLRRFVKKASAPTGGNRNAKVNNSIVGLIQKIEQNGKYIEEKRRGLEFAYNKREEVDSFLRDTEWEKTPLGVYVVQQRKVREERRKILAEAAAKEDAKGKKGRSKGTGREEESEDEEESDVEMGGATDESGGSDEKMSD